MAEREGMIMVAKTAKPIKIFVLEDDPDILRLVQHHLKLANFEPVGFASSIGMLEQAVRVQPALFLLDIMLPGDSGLEVCRRIRQNHKLEMTPVMFLTAKGEESDRVTGLELGADDYVVKPFSPRELVARIRAVLRRAQRPEKPNINRVGELEINGEAMSISVNGNPSAPRLPSIDSSSTWPRMRAAYLHAINSLTRFGATRTSSLCARLTSSCADCAKKLNPILSTRPT
jgi:CheY-like chemotaxis protein